MMVAVAHAVAEGRVDVCAVLSLETMLGPVAHADAGHHVDVRGPCCR